MRQRFIAVLMPGLCAAQLLFFLALSPRGSGARTAEEADRISPQELQRMPKYDAHAHVMALAPGQAEKFVSFLDRHGYRWLDICTSGMKWDLLRTKMELAQSLHSRYPRQFAWAGSFNLTNWGKPEWQREALGTIDASLARGAVAVKVWKEIGMSLKDPDGKYVMIDDARFDPILDQVERQNSTLTAHLGEPRNCWLPLAQMTTESDRRYFAANPQYHGFLHPEVPSYWDQIAATDRMLERHPKLRVVGCHLGSLEFDVDEIAKRLDKHPGFAVDLAARLVHLQIQPREKVRNFLIKYQDRVLYATDAEIGDERGGTGNFDKELARLEQTYSLDQSWLATDEMVDVPRAAPSFKSRGVALPSSVLRKIYYDNARKWYRIE